MKFLTSFVGCGIGISLYKLGAALVTADINAARFAAVACVLFFIAAGFVLAHALKEDDR